MAAKFPIQAQEIEWLLVKFELTPEELARVAQLADKTPFPGPGPARPKTMAISATRSTK